MKKQSARLLVWLTLLGLVSLLLSGCGDSSPTTAANPTTAATASSSPATAATTAPGSTATTSTLAGTAATNPGTGEVIVFAASSLTDSFNQIKTAFEAANSGTKVTLNFAGSSTLRQQLQQGAKADVFASADQSNTDQALKATLVADKGQTFARNRLVIIVPKANKANISQPADIAKPGIKFVTAQKDVPVGNYTLQVLDKMSKDATFGSDFSTKVLANFVSQETDVKQIVAKVQTGEADVGIVYRTDVTAKVTNDVTVIEIPDQYNVIATYPIATTASPVNPTLAKTFIAYVMSGAGQAILTKNNFLPAMAAAQSTPSTSFQITGAVTTPTQVALADLTAMTATSVTTNPQSSKGAMGEHTYSGPLLYDLLQKAGLVTDSNRKNDSLRKAIIVTGSDGYSVAIAWGEIDPKFAGKKVIVAATQDSKPLPTSDGFARLIVPGDSFAGRYVSNVVKIEVKDAGDPPQMGTRKASTTFMLGGLVNTPGAYTVDTLKALKQTQATVDEKDAQGNAVKTTYSGVLLNDLLLSAGLKLDASAKNANLRAGIVAVGSDGYSALIVDGEIDPKFGNVPVLVATGKNGQPLADSDGFARLVVPGDNAQGRYVSNLVALNVVSFS